MTLAADRGYATRELVQRLKELNVTPQVARNVSGRASAEDGRTTRHEGYWVSQRRRKLGGGIRRMGEDGSGAEEGEAEEEG